MYIWLLAWRYLRTRFIALASVVSVTLGVATLIVVNSVMSGFVEEMYDRLHGVLSDIDISSSGMNEIYGGQWRINQVESLLGDDLEAATGVVQVPAMLQFELPNGRPILQQVMLIGIDDATYGKVAEFQGFLLNQGLRENLDFQLREQGYDPALGRVGWPYRREQAEFRRQMMEAWSGPTAPPAPEIPNGSGATQVSQATAMAEEQPVNSAVATPDPVAPIGAVESNKPNLVGRHVDAGSIRHDGIHDGDVGQTTKPNLVGLPERPPDLGHLAGGDLLNPSPTATDESAPGWSDPYAATRQQINPEPIFDPMRDQYTGLILGRAIANRHYRDPDTGENKDIYLIRPGDDVQVMLPTAGNTPAAITHRCTVVDFYHSKMHEYDANFAFMPLSKLQQIRGMIDPQTGIRNVTAIQIKLKPDADLERAKQKLGSFFRPDEPPFLVVQTWMDQQRPLLSAVTMELTILNILLFLIIAVAGFGILATFYMIVVEKTKDIGILKALGASRRGVMGIFLGYGLSLGAVGAGAGIALGLAFVANINLVADGISYATGREVFDPTMYFFSEIPTVVSPVCVLWVAVGAVLIAVLASVLPALRAARLNPVEALRYE